MGFWYIMNQGLTIAYTAMPTTHGLIPSEIAIGAMNAMKMLINAISEAMTKRSATVTSAMPATNRNGENARCSSAGPTSPTTQVSMPVYENTVASPIAVPMKTRFSQLSEERNSLSVHTRRPRNAATPATPTATDGMPCKGSSTHSATVAKMMTSIFFSASDMGPRSASSVGWGFAAAPSGKAGSGAVSPQSAQPPAAAAAWAPRRASTCPCFRRRSPLGPYSRTITA